jgi:hypothetical protein
LKKKVDEDLGNITEIVSRIELPEEKAIIDDEEEE